MFSVALFLILSLSFSSGITNLLMFSVALFLILSLAFLGVFSVTFLFILSATFLFIFSFTLLFRNLLTLLLWNRPSLRYLNSMTLLFGLVVHLSIPNCVTFLFIFSGALFVIGSHFMWHLDSVTFLSRFIPALFFPYCSTGRYTTVGATNQKQKYQYLHHFR